MYDKDKLLQAIWENPEACTGLHFEKKAGKWESRQRPDGSEDTHTYTTLRLKPDGSNIFATYNGGSFQNGDVWQLLMLQLNTNDFSDVADYVGKMYGIEPEYKYNSAEQRQRAERRRTEAEMLQAMAAYVTEQLNTDSSSAQQTRAYLNSRGLQASPRLGTYSREVWDGLRNMLKTSYSLNENKAQEVLRRYFPVWEANDYRLIIPYLNGSGKCTGFCLRLTAEQDTYTDRNGQQQKKNKYMYSKDMPKGGYCENLSHTAPVLLVEGLLDAEAVKQAAERAAVEAEQRAATATGEAADYARQEAADYRQLLNVVALGGMTPTNDTEDAAKSQIKTLQRYGAKRLIYVPDLEYNADGTQKTDATRRTIAALLPYLTGDNAGAGFVSLNIAQLYNTEAGSTEKQDADTFTRQNGIQRLRSVVNSAEAWYKWQLWCDVYDNRGDSVGMAAAAVHTYNSIHNHIERELLRREFAQAQAPAYIEQLKQAGVTAGVLSNIDRDGEASTWRTRITDKIGNLHTAAERNAAPEEIGRLLTEAQRIQRTGTADSFTAQANLTREQMHTLVAQKPDYLQTCWKLYAHSDRENGKAYEVRRISFAPAAVTIVAAPTNHGKTLFMLQTCLQVAQSTGKHYIYISTENDAEQLYIRALAATIGDKWKNAQDEYGKAVQNPRSVLREAIKDEDMPAQIFTNNLHSQTLNIPAEIDRYWRTIAPHVSLLRIGTDVEAICSNVAAQVEAWKNAGEDVGGIFIDYIQQLRTGGRAYSRTDEMQTICGSLNDLAKTTQLPVIAAAQLNRDATKNTGDKLDGVELANIGESSGIENIAEDVYLLWQVDKINTKSAEYRKGEDFSLKPQQYRTRRCFLSDTDETTKRTGYLYIENIKARDYATGCYCLLPFNGAAGSIKCTEDASTSTPKR